MLRDGREERGRGGGIAMDAQMREDEWAEQPRPCGALVIGGVALALRTDIVAAITGLASAQTAQRDSCQ